MILGLDFRESVFMHAILLVHDLPNGDESWTKNSLLWRYFQNYEIHIGDSPDYETNTKCAGGPFLNAEDPQSFVHDEYA